MEKLFNLIKHHNPKSSSDILRADELPTPLVPPPASGSLARASKRAPAAEDMALAAGETPPAPAAAKPGTASDEPARRDETALIRPDSFCTQKSSETEKHVKETLAGTVKLEKHVNAHDQSTIKAASSHITHRSAPRNVGTQRECSNHCHVWLPLRRQNRLLMRWREH